MQEMIDKDSKIDSLVFSFFLCLLLVCVAGLRPIGIDNDSGNYYKLLHKYYQNDKMYFVLIEPAFWFIAFISKYLFQCNYQFAFFLYALLGVFINVYSIRRISIKPYASIFVYLCIFFVLHEMTQIRVGVSCGLFLSSIPDLYNKDRKKYLLKNFIAVLFHYSALVSLILLFINPKKMNKAFYLILPVLGFAFSFALQARIFSVFQGLSYKADLYIKASLSGDNQGLNIFNFYYLGLIFFYYVYVSNIDKSKSKYDILLAKILGIMLFCYYSLSRIPAFAVRFSEFFGIVVPVILINFVFLFKQRKIVLLFVVVFAMTMLYNYLFRQGMLRFEYYGL
jgi:hypothetical protein